MSKALISWRENVPLMADGTCDALLASVGALRSEYEVYPPQGLELAALRLTGFDDVRVVLLGQDPYHGPGQAMGLSFSVPEGVKAPPSLRNIFKEIDASLYPGESREHSTDLTRWAEQGVLLLNSVLTVQAKKPGSHAKLGWQGFTDSIIQALSDKREGLVFLLWGNYARTKAHLIDDSRHTILETTHPSPFSAHKGFLGCNHFALANSFLDSSIVW